jgi:nucleoside-diphosphate-sugar epimerase
MGKIALITGITGQDGAYLAELIASSCGFEGKILFDSAMPDGAPQKLLDIRRIQSLGWKAQIPLAQGIRTTRDWMISGL